MRKAARQDRLIPLAALIDEFGVAHYPRKYNQTSNRSLRAKEPACFSMRLF
jgi:hypothetical protein